MPQKLVSTVESPVRYPAILHQALELALGTPGVWIDVLHCYDKQEAQVMWRKLNTFSHSWGKFPSYSPMMTKILERKRIAGRKLARFGGLDGWVVQMRVVERPSATWENSL